MLPPDRERFPCKDTHMQSIRPTNTHYSEAFEQAFAMVQVDVGSCIRAINRVFYPYLYKWNGDTSDLLEFSSALCRCAIKREKNHPKHDPIVEHARKLHAKFKSFCKQARKDGRFDSQQKEKVS